MSFGDLKVQDLIYEDSSNNEITVVIADLATKHNPTFTGTVIIPTAPASDVSTKAASTAFVDAYYATKAAPAFSGNATGVNLTLSGNLVVNGTTTTINTQTLDVEDINITLGKVSTPSDTTANNGGITLKGSSDKTFNWINSTDAWTSSEHIHLLNDKDLILGTDSHGSLSYTSASSSVDLTNRNTSIELIDTGSSAGSIQLKVDGGNQFFVNDRGFVAPGLGTVGMQWAPILSQDTVLGVRGRGSYTSNLAVIDLTSSQASVGGADVKYGKIRFSWDNTTHVHDNGTAIIEGCSGAASSSADRATALKFYTAPTGSAGSYAALPIERLRIWKDGQIGIGGANYGSSGQVLTSGGSGAAPSWANAPAGGNTFTAVANGSIANNKAVKIQSDGKVSEIKETAQNRSVPAAVISAGQNFYVNDANSQGADIRANRKSTTVYDPDTGRVLIIWGDNGYLKCRVGTPNKTTGNTTWGNVISINSSDNFKEMSAVYDTTADKIILFVAKDNSPSRLEGYVGTVASSGNSVTWSSATSPGNGEIRYCSSAFDPTTARTIVVFQDVASGGCKFQICYINSGTLTWHTGATSNSNMISTDMFGAAVNTTSFGIISVDSSKWLFCCAMESTSPPSGFTNKALYAKIINASTNTSAAPTYANAGAKQIETPSSTQRGQDPRISWDPTLEKIVYTWQAKSGGSETSNDHFAMLCYFNSGKTDITINDATYNVGGSGNTGTEHQLAYESGSGRFIFTVEDYAGVRGSFLSCGGSNNNTLTVGGRGTMYSPNPLNFGTKNYKDLIDITGGYMFSFYTNQIASSSAANKTATSIISTQEMATNLTDAESYVGFVDQAYTNGQTATISTYGNTVNTLSGMTSGTPYYVQGDGSIATTVDSSLSLGSNRPLAGMALSATKLLIRDPLAKA